MSYTSETNDRRAEGVSNGQLWAELRYIRTKVDAVETKVLYMFGTISAIAVAIAVFEVLSRAP